MGTGGINYNLKLGDKVFGWGCGDRITPEVSTEELADARTSSLTALSTGPWFSYTSIGNEVRVLDGDARGETGIVVGKFGSSVLIRFADGVKEKLSVGDRLQAKSVGTGLEIDGFKDVMIHWLTPDLVEKLATRTSDNMIEVPVVKEIPAEIVGQGAGSPAMMGNWHIQTAYAPDIKEYGLDELRFGDLVLLKDTQSDYWKGYYQGGATLGIVCSGPSEVSAMGIAVTPIMSTRFRKIKSRIDPTANIGKYLGILNEESLKLSAIALRKESVLSSKKKTGDSGRRTLKTNADKLIKTSVEAVVQPPGGLAYEIGYDGKPKLGIGMASINYNVSLGDPTYGWADSDHVEPDVTIQGRDKASPSECGVAILSCIGNKAIIISGEAKGAEGYYLGRHAGSDDKVWFPKEAVEKLALNDRVRIEAQGVGLKIDGFEDVRVNKLSPWVLEKLGISVEGNEIVVPVVMEVPGHIMGSGLGGPLNESVDYDIQTTDPRTVEQYGLKKLKLGDLVAIRDHYDYYGRGRYKGAVTIGVCIHGFSDFGGHGPGINPILSALPGRIKIKFDPDANMAYVLGIKTKPKKLKSIYLPDRSSKSMGIFFCLFFSYYEGKLQSLSLESADVSPRRDREHHISFQYGAGFAVLHC